LFGLSVYAYVSPVITWLDEEGSSMNRICHRVYLAAISGWIMPARLRKVIARSELHRAWVLGHLRFFREAGIAYGPANPYPTIKPSLDTADP
jgi:hypothetical protein